MMLESLFKKVMQLRRHAAKKAREMVQQNRNGWRWIAGKLSDCSEQDQQNAKYIL
jgi:DNA gyrase/topoisomerase IV subunit B